MKAVNQDTKQVKALGFVTSVICGSFFMSLLYCNLVFGSKNPTWGTIFMLGVGTLMGILPSLSPNVGRAGARAFFFVIILLCLYGFVSSLWGGDSAEASLLLGVGSFMYLLRRHFVVPHSVGLDEKSL